MGQRLSGPRPRSVIPRWGTFQGYYLTRAEDMFLFPPAWTLETRLSSEARILELWDTLVLVISGTFADSFCSSLPHHGPREPVSVSGCYTSPYYFTIRSDGPRHGSRLRLGLIGRGFEDPGACLRHHTSD